MRRRMAKRRYPFINFNRAGENNEISRKKSFFSLSFSSKGVAFFHGKKGLTSIGSINLKYYIYIKFFELRRNL